MYTYHRNHTHRETERQNLIFFLRSSHALMTSFTTWSMYLRIHLSFLYIAACGIKHTPLLIYPPLSLYTYIILHMIMHTHNPSTCNACTHISHPFTAYVARAPSHLHPYLSLLYTYIHIHSIYVIHVYIYIYMYVYTCICMYVSIYIYIYTYMYTYIHIYVSPLGTSAVDPCRSFVVGREHRSFREWLKLFMGS